MNADNPCNVTDALELVRQKGGTLNGALLDVNLRGERSYPVADTLTARGVRLVFTIGYNAATLEQGYRSYPQCGKPFVRRTLLAALESAIN